MADILFINTAETLAINQEANGTMLLATKLLQAGFDVDILRFGQIESYNKDYSDFINKIAGRILEISPKCVSFYTLWPTYHIILRISCEIKKRNPDIITVLGGPQASATAHATLNAAGYVDYICTGEGENTVVPFFKTILEEAGANLASIPGLYYRKNGSVASNNIDMPLCDLNTLPFWDKRLILDTPEPNIGSNTYFMPIDAGRGCPYNCTFCCTSHFWRRTYRLKSPERIIEDILFFKNKFGIKSFWFSHDAFTSNKQLVSKVCDRILETGLDIKWRCTARVDCITEDLVLKMKQAGLTRIEVGIETGSLRMQKLINKNLNLDKSKKMVAFLLKNGLEVGLFFMYGFPDENEQDLNDTLELLFSLIDSGVHHVSMSFCKFTPTTEITEKHFDQLELDPNIKILSRGIFGYDEELQTIKQNKAMFPFFYNLKTPVRNEYQYLYFLANLYQQFPISIRYLRKLYMGDNLQFYKDFYYNNLSFFEKDMVYATEGISEHALEMLYNTMKDFNFPYIRQIKALLKYEYNIRQVFWAKEDVSLQETYDFSYIDFKLKLPIEKYSDGKTEILLQKIDGKTSMKVLHIT